MKLIQYFTIDSHINLSSAEQLVRAEENELSLINVPNASTLWCLIKEELRNNIDTCGNKINLINMDESQFKIKINEIYNKRKNVII